MFCLQPYLPRIRPFARCSAGILSPQVTPSLITTIRCVTVKHVRPFIRISRTSFICFFANRRINLPKPSPSWYDA